MQSRSGSGSSNLRGLHEEGGPCTTEWADGPKATFESIRGPVLNSSVRGRRNEICVRSSLYVLCIFHNSSVHTYVVALRVLICVGLLGVSLAQTVIIDPVGAVTAVEGNNLTITCSDGVNGTRFLLRENNMQLIGDNTPPNELNGTMHIFRFPVNRTKDSNTYDCLQVITAMFSSQIDLNVICEWNGAQTRHVDFSYFVYILSIYCSTVLICWILQNDKAM